MADNNTTMTELQIENGRALVERLRTKPDQMVDFAAWVIEQMWAALVDQSDVVSLDMSEALHRSGFNADFMGRHTIR